ncbi:hypothetical protein [Rheinheimera soli]|uniref:Uncharacterized protein n=1 Tax=Rheinheimera soli TaxID=443616 RepID=A0ABU1W5E6_9GAMM|nr:hypothetical protein [Rheinheimera soli]MDR7123161.1 hypothetical protein [Rheinheimera soli]
MLPKNKINNAIGVTEIALSSLEHKLLKLEKEVTDNCMTKRRFDRQMMEIISLVEITKSSVSKMKFFILEKDHC